MSKSRWYYLAAAIVVVAGGFWMWKGRAAKEAPKYRTDQVQRGSIEATVSATGTLEPVMQVEVGSQVSGTVYRLHADYNDRVRQGQMLCELEPSSLRARVVQNEAAVARADAALTDAQRALRRARELAADKYISEADIETAGVTVQQREADLRAARAQLEAARVDLGHTFIRAPIDGVVISRNIDLGQTVAASLQAPKLFVIANDLAQMQVETRIDEADIGVVHQDLPVTFTVDAFPDRLFKGRVAQVRIEPIIQSGVVTYTTVIRTENPELKLKPGMTANVSVLVARRDDVIKVPASALRFRPPESGKARRAGRGAAGGTSEGPRPAQAVGPGGGAGGTASAAPAGPGAQASGGERRGGEGGGAGGGAGMTRRAGARGPEGARMAGGGMGAPGGRAGGTRGPQPADTRQAAGAEATERGFAGEHADEDLPAAKPGTVYLLRAGRPVKVQVMTGISDGAWVEVTGDGLEAGDLVITGNDTPVTRGQTMMPPPGMGGPMMGRGPGGGGGRR